MAKRPYLGYLIAGAVVCSEGGSLLLAGLEVGYLSTMINSSLSSISSISGYSSGVNPSPPDFLIVMANALIIIGAISLCIGVGLLYNGVTKRKEWLLHNSPLKYEPGIGMEQSSFQHPAPTFQQTTQSPNAETKFCASCGARLPNAPNVIFCPQCGANLK